ncbi:TPA: hypothetical protein DIV49_02030 [Candidatus Saccharibacteria bacterium]|nr:hypothetical protein [Candidatus Saccharibacteria bacterium]HRF28063.1 hypothetical protein [Candidatus Saccharibacteria bacterium]
MLRKTIAIVLAAQVVGIFLVVSNLNFFNTNSPLENFLGSVGGALFWLAPVVGAIVLATQKSKKGSLTSYAYTLLRNLGILFAFTVGPWLLLWGVNWSYSAARQAIDAEEVRQSQIRSEEYSNAIGEAREEEWARTCLTARTLSTDLQVSALYYDYQDAKIYLQQHASNEVLSKVNQHVKAINTQFHECEAGDVTPTAQRNEIRNRLEKIIALSESKE